MSNRSGLLRLAQLGLPIVATLVALGGTTYAAFLVTTTKTEFFPKQEAAIITHPTLWQDDPIKVLLTILIACMAPAVAVCAAFLNDKSRSRDTLYGLFGAGIFSVALAFVFGSSFFVPFILSGALVLGAGTAAHLRNQVDPVDDSWLELGDDQPPEEIIEAPSTEKSKDKTKAA
jgi:hypothetical protein